MNSLRLILQFSFKPNTLGLCGRRDDKIYELLKKEDWTSGEEERVKLFAKDLKVLYAYLKSVGEASGMNPFDEEVVRACLVGWNKWDQFDVASHLKENLKKVAIPKKLKEIETLPTGVPFTHNFHTLYFGAVASDIPRVLGFADRCKVSLGKIMEGGVAEYNRLMPGLKTEMSEMSIESPFIEVGTGDGVFVHHGIVFKRAVPEEVTIYQRDLKKVINSVKRFW